MAKTFQSEKGFLIIEASDLEVVSIGGLGFCDSCSKPKSSGYIVSVLGARWYCEKCYEEWHNRAINYPEDHEYEKRVFERYSHVFNI